MYRDKQDPGWANLKYVSVFTVILALFTFLVATPARAEVVEITSPINHQTVFSKSGEVRINFRVNASTLHNIPHMITLYINNVAQKEIPYNSSKYFLLSGVPDGTYHVSIGVFGIDKRPMFISPVRKFNVSTKPLVLTDRL